MLLGSAFVVFSNVGLSPTATSGWPGKTGQSPDPRAAEIVRSARCLQRHSPRVVHFRTVRRRGRRRSCRRDTAPVRVVFTRLALGDRTFLTDRKSARLSREPLDRCFPGKALIFFVDCCYQVSFAHRRTTADAEPLGDLVEVRLRGIRIDATSAGCFPIPGGPVI